MPGSAMAPGPGRSAEASTRPLPVAGMQNTEASVAFAGVLKKSVPPDEPVSLIVRQAALPKQPACAWLVQKMPLALLALAPVVPSGERVTEIAPTCEPSQQLPPPAVQGQLQEEAGEQQFPLPACAAGHGVATVPTPPVGQSRV